MQLLQALQEWKDVHPVDMTIKSIDKPPTPRNRSFHARTNTHAHACAPKLRPFVYGDSESHKSSECDTVTTISDRKRKLSEKGLCFECTGSKLLNAAVNRLVSTANSATIPQFAVGNSQQKRKQCSQPQIKGTKCAYRSLSSNSMASYAEPSWTLGPPGHISPVTCSTY